MQTSCRDYFHPAFNLKYIGDCFPGGKAPGAWRTVHLFTVPRLKCMDIVPYDLMTFITILLLIYYLILNVIFRRESVYMRVRALKYNAVCQSPKVTTSSLSD
jgi:hypothetical protein